MFGGTLRENIGFDLGHADAAILQAARVASLDSVIADLPLGLDSPVTQGGSNLSGGQRQRVSLARGVLAATGSTLLLLDEPTSALDPITEAAVYDRILEDFADVCVVAAVHRLSLLDRFDRVILMMGGQVIDSGTTAELAERQPTFRSMLHTDRSLREPNLADAA
jgi:ABC-type multidrug transport system fused ATPase/permease subunit